MRSHSARVHAGLLLALFAFGVAPAGGLAQKAPPIVAPGGSDADKARLAELRAVATGDDRIAARKALLEIKAMGPVGKPTLIDALRVVLIRDRTLLEQAARKASAPGNALAAIESAAAEQRGSANRLVQEMSDPAAVRAARASYQKLRTTIAKLTDAYDTRSTLLDLMRVRPLLVAMWAEVDPKVGPKVVDPAAEAKLTAAVDAALGEKLLPVLKELQAKPEETADPAPTSPEQEGLLAWRMRRRVDFYNHSLAPQADPQELELVRMINAYRDALGLPALELDARLLQAARRHSREMVEQNYFSPTSPNDATRDAVARMKAAGFEPAQQWSEALARNTRSATETFWNMFDTPQYHQAIASPTMTAVGVGRWNSHWTIELAAAPRLMMATAEERNNAQVQGDICEPQVATRGERAGRGAGGNDDGRPTDPTKIRPMLPGGGTPSIPALPGLPGL